MAYTATERKQRSNHLLDIRQTEQLKGLSIFLVILGHLWVHVSTIKPALIFSGDAVSMFLILSGYGLTISAGKAKLNFKTFALKRLRRVMAPYWIVTLFIVLLDILLLNKILSANSIIETFLGLNFTEETKRIDYVRWFITFLLFWYSVFFAVHNLFPVRMRALVFIIVSIIFQLADYYIFHWMWYQYLSFPLGCIFAMYKEDILQVLADHQTRIYLILGIGLIFAILSKIALHHEPVKDLLSRSVPNICLVYLKEASSIILGIGLILILGYIGHRGFESKLLLILGKYSYELYLLHGVFLIKYNFFFRSTNIVAIVIGLFLMISFLIYLSLVADKFMKSNTYLRTRISA